MSGAIAEEEFESVIHLGRIEFDDDQVMFALVLEDDFPISDEERLSMISPRLLFGGKLWSRVEASGVLTDNTPFHQVGAQEEENRGMPLAIRLTSASLRHSVIVSSRYS